MSKAARAGTIVELLTPRGRENVDQLLNLVTIRSLEDIHDAAVAMARIAHECGLQVAVCVDISSKEPMVDAEGTILNADVFGWKDDGMRWWQDHRLALDSSLIRAIRYESEPFWANHNGFHGHWPNGYLDDIDITDFAHHVRRLYKAAIVVPVHLPFGQISASCFVSKDREKEDLSAEFTEHGSLLAQLIRRFVAGYVQAHRTKRRIRSDCVLSKRAVECLRWAAIGKTDKEISMILGLSHATVRYHIQQASEKLDSVNRAQTIFKAGQLGYLGASD